MSGMQDGPGAHPPDESVSVTALFSANSPPPEAPLAANTVSAAVDVQAESSRSRSPSSSRLKTDPDVEHQLDFPAEDEDEKPDFLRKDLLPSAKRSKKKGRGASSSTPPPAPVLIDNLPTAWDEAHDSFGTLERCVYEHKNLGLSREQDEMMVCDCIYDRDDPDAEPCGHNSDCINRAIFIECLADECRAGKHCNNQRFSKRQFANVQIVQTEMKGYGLRAEQNLPSGTLVYEYIGEVVAEKMFRKRMQAYAEEGIRHFYFMMLQKEEYIDATKKGGIGRFANHSCNPNCEVQKWVVGRRLRMGIFTKRDILRGEEITFNYNVDRYGHDAQPCYCGEPNCVGTIGGKTQTDIGGMNDLFLDALGITDEVEALGMKGSKKKKSRKLDEDFIPTLRPIEEADVQKVAAAMRQSMENRKMMSRLLERVKLTDELAVHRQLMRMHGFSLMSMVLTGMADDQGIVLLALEVMSKWKLQIRNKIEDSKVEEPVRTLVHTEDERIGALAEQLLGYWSTLELSYRIPRVSKIASLDADDDAATTTIAEANLQATRESRRPEAWENTSSIHLDIAPVRPRPPPAFSRPRPPPPPPQPPKPAHTNSNERLKLDAIIALAQQTVTAASAAPSTPGAVVGQSPAASAATESSRSGSRAAQEGHGEERRKRIKRSHARAQIEDDDRKEKRLTKMIGEVVVRSMSKYKEQMEHETFKRYAKECTLVLVEKEKKGHSYTSSRHPSLTEDKKAKIKAFTKEYTHKVLKKLKEKGKLRRPNGQDHSHGSGDPAASASSRHPNGNGFVYDNGSSPVTDTPSATPLSTSTPSAVLRTPNRRESAIAGELDDIFGVDPPEEDMHVDVDVKEEPFLPNLATPDQDRDQSPDVSALETGAAGTEKKMRRNSVVTKVQIGALGTPGTPTSGGPSPVDQV